MKNRSAALLLAAVFAAAGTMAAQAETMPDVTSTEFCQKAQQLLANTSMVSTNEIFDNMPAYRASKPSVDPLLTYQVVTYEGATPIVVSCKVKAVDHIQLTYGEDKAGPQDGCPKIATMLKDQAVAELLAEGNPGAAEIVKGFEIATTESVLMGSDYLADFQPVTEANGKTTVHSPGLQVDWDTWWSYVMPDRFLGQTYCHLATPAYLKAIATGDLQPGILVTTVDEAPTVPQ